VTFREFLDRYGLALGALAALALVIALLPGNTDDSALLDANAGANGGDQFDTSAGGQVNEGSGGGTGSGGGAGSLSGSDGDTVVAGDGGGGGGGGGEGGQPAPPTGSDVAFGQGPDCGANGRQKGISGYMVPCVQWNGTNNGGDTARGVTRDKVLVVSWLGQEDPATRQALTGARLNDQPAVVKRAYEALFAYSNQHYQTYGRKVEFVELNASGPSESDEAMKADAIKIADEIGAFAVFTGNALAPLPNVLARELAQRGVLCICTTSLSSEYYNELPPLIFSSLPTINEYAQHAAEYIAKRMGRKNAEFAGAQYQALPRVYCLMYLNGTGEKVDPEGKRARDITVREFAKRGLKFKTEVAYLYDPGSNQNDVTAMMTKFKSEGCTTLVPLIDPIMPILITREATNQQYFPEWFIVGTGLSDTTTIARFYDQAQWQHAFGISPLWVTWDRVEQSAGYREFHHGMPGMSKGDEGVLINIYRASVQTLFRGIHMAGPVLNNETFVAGMYAYPKTGGTPAAPLVYLTRQYPTEIKDFAEVWYDPSRVGPDERSENGPGMIVKADGGKRYDLGEWPTSPPSRANGVTVTSEQGNPPHEQDGHSHKSSCLSCA